jgi:hypothetical protein
LFAAWATVASADQGSFANSGGTSSAGSGVTVSSSVAAPPGTLNLNCPPTTTGNCAGGSFAFVSTDGTQSISASFTSGAYVEGCSGGGRGGHVTCSWTFNGKFSGTWTVNGATQAITGETAQAFGTGGAPAQGTTAFNSSYAPFYYSDSEQILRSDDLLGTNQITYGTQGSGVGQFYGANGIALDARGRIYVADTYNCRVVRIDDINGTNWTTYGTCGSGPGQFADPGGIAIDANGEIYVMDSGNYRVVRMDDMNGTNWVSYGSAGSGVGQFAAYLSSVAVDASGRIYVADTGNLRIVRFDDMAGANWTALTQSAPVNGVSYGFQSPVAVALDAGGKLYIADNESYQPAVIRVDDMAGDNWTQVYVGAGQGLNSIAVDSTGMVMTGGGGVKFVDGMTGVLASSGAIAPYGTYYVFGVTPLPLPATRPSAISFSPTSLSLSQNVGGTSAAQPIVVSNFGGSPLDVSNVTASGPFAATPNCPPTLTPGSTCTVSVTFTPPTTGPASGLLTFTDDSGNLGATQTLALSGVGTAPAASVSPTSVSFLPQVVGSTSAVRSVTLQDTGTGPLTVASVAVTGPFSQTNTCTGSLAPNATCTVQVTFAPTTTGSATGALTVTDDAGTQSVALSGSGIAPVTLSNSSLSFGTVVTGTVSAVKKVTLTNHQSVALNFASITTTGGFNLASNTCGTSIAAGANCSVGVTFSPTTTDSASGTLTFVDDAGNSPQIVSLSGSGVAPVTLSASSLSFGTVRVGTTSQSKRVTLTNHQTVALSFASITTSAGFNVASNSCGTAIAAGASCSVGVTFSPAASGPVTGTLTFADDAGNSPQLVSLSGTGR